MQQLNSYNVAQLQYALRSDKHDIDSISFLNHDLSPDASPPIIHPDSELDYPPRRMSSSAASTADTDSTNISRPEKRSATPADSPQPKLLRNVLDENNWDKPEDDHSKVQLPSIFTTFEDKYHHHDGRRASMPSLLSESRIRHAPYPPTSLRHAYPPTPLSTYTFPPTTTSDDPDKNPPRPKLSTDLNFNVVGQYDSSPYSNGTAPSATFSSSTFASPASSDYHRSAGLSSYPEHESWNPSPSGIPRPSSTPGQVSNPTAKYDDHGVRHASFSAPMSQAQMFAGSTRISGQHDRRSLSTIKSEWSFPSNDFVLPSANPSSYSPPMPSAAPPIVVSNSPARSPQTVPSSTLVDRPQRKRGKLPKETTDYLKAWLHRHSDHPYPSEDEKKQLCHVTGLSMSQVSNWMINARRRILAPAHRAASGPTTTAPFPPTGRNNSLTGILDHAAARRSSMPSADSLQLYHPLTLQSMPASHHSDYAPSGRGMLAVPVSRGSHQLGPASGMEVNTRHHMGLYHSGHGPHSAGPTPSPHYMSSEVPLSAPPSLSTNPFSSHHSSPAQNVYSSYNSRHSGQGEQPPPPPPPHHPSSHYFSEGHSHPGSAPGSGYATPQ